MSISGPRPEHDPLTASEEWNESDEDRPFKRWSRRQGEATQTGHTDELGMPTQIDGRAPEASMDLHEDDPTRLQYRFDKRELGNKNSADHEEQHFSEAATVNVGWARDGISDPGLALDPPTNESLALDPNLVLGRYRIRERIGGGGFGSVYTASDELLRRDVAVKIVPCDSDTPDRIRREAMASARLDHPAIVRIFDAQEENGAFYLVSELVRGATLAELEKTAELGDADVILIGVAIAEALAHAHERGVIHRDIKPHNVIIPREEEDLRSAYAKLTDFGIAQLVDGESLTMTGEVVGTLAYMAPEQAHGQRGDEQTDLYALALMLYEALAGTNPRRGEGPAITAARVDSVLPSLNRYRKDLPVQLCHAIDRALDPDPPMRGQLVELTCALNDALPTLDSQPRYLQERCERFGGLSWLPSQISYRWFAGFGAAVLALCALLGPLAPVVGQHQYLGRPLGVAAICFLVYFTVAALPRIGWIGLVGAIVVLLVIKPLDGNSTTPHSGTGLLLTLALAGPPLLLRYRPALWSLPLAAPLLGAIGLTAVYPGMVGSVRGIWARAIIGGLGGWWLLLSEPIVGRGLLFDTQVVTASDHLATTTTVAGDTIINLFSSSALIVIPIWAVAAAVLPYLVRGASLMIDMIGGLVWTAALVAVMAGIDRMTGLSGAAATQETLTRIVISATIGCGIAIYLARQRAVTTDSNLYSS